MKQGVFITLEGNDGAGKTTVCMGLRKELEARGYSVVYTREPGGVKIAEDIRKVILNVDNVGMEPECEALLYAAARMEHLNKKVIPSLKEGKVVLCDRYLDSSIAYQGVARGLGLENILKINSFALDHLPDLTIFIDVKPEVALKRLSLRDKTDRLDLETIDFHNKVYEGYHEALKLYPERFVVIDGNQALNDVVNDCKKAVLKYLGV